MVGHIGRAESDGLRGQGDVPPSSGPFRRLLALFRPYREAGPGAGVREREHGFARLPSEALRVTEGVESDDDDRDEERENEQSLSDAVGALLDSTHRVASTLRASERGWDWDVSVLPKSDADSTRTIDPDEAARQADADLADLLQVSRRASAARRRKQRSEEE